MRHALLPLVLAVLTLPAGCKSAYYGTMEAFGVEKRDILVDRIGSARDKQEAAKEQFTSALEQFRSVVAFDGGDLEAVYDKLNRGYERSDSAADAVSGRIDAVESVAEALFDEWASELDEYESDALRRDSAQKLAETRKQYEQMLAAMRRAEATMPPVLSALKDQVLYLKHNLNAQAVASIRGEAQGIERDIASLIQEMQTSIDEANAFIDQMGGS